MDCRTSKGFTLIELVITMAIIIVVVSIAIPSFSGFWRDAELKTQTNLFLSAFHYARTEALMRGFPVFLCASDGDECSDSSDWHLGWIVYVDLNGNGSLGSDEQIRTFPALSEGYSLQPNVNAPSLQFWPDGQVRRKSGALPLMTFRLCGPGADDTNMEERAREFVISSTGRVRLRFGRPGKTKC